MPQCASDQPQLGFLYGMTARLVGISTAQSMEQ